VGVGAQWLLAGSPSLTAVASAEADERGLDYVLGSSPPTELGSDHASFMNAGIPAIFFHGFFSVIADDPHYHTAEDQAQHVQPTRMAEIAEVGLAVIDVLLASR
jgi:Zn-dependent M28 family amino/carboxypeptidase